MNLKEHTAFLHQLKHGPHEGRMTNVEWAEVVSTVKQYQAEAKEELTWMCAKLEIDFGRVSKSVDERMGRCVQTLYSAAVGDAICAELKRAGCSFKVSPQDLSVPTFRDELFRLNAVLREHDRRTEG